MDYGYVYSGRLYLDDRNVDMSDPYVDLVPSRHPQRFYLSTLYTSEY